MNNRKSVSRRDFMKKSLVGAALMASASSIELPAAQKKAGSGCEKARLQGGLLPRRRRGKG
ncbi:MAG: twin-arginine translocation signal domain-containing protein [Planctomycetota bacterium]